MTDLILWRHGQTDYNSQGRIQGRVDVPLNETGRDQARRAAEDIADGGVPVPDAQLDTELVRGGVGGESLKELLVRQGHNHVPSLISAALPEGDPPRS